MDISNRKMVFYLTTGAGTYPCFQVTWQLSMVLTGGTKEYAEARLDCSSAAIVVITCCCQ